MTLGTRALSAAEGCSASSVCCERVSTCSVAMELSLGWGSRSGGIERPRILRIKAGYKAPEDFPLLHLRGMSYRSKRDKRTRTATNMPIQPQYRDTVSVTCANLFVCSPETGKV